jgi:hypothetical protein
MLHRFGRAVSIVIGDVIYFPAVYAAAVVDRLDITKNSSADDSVRRGRAAERKDPPTLISDGVTPGASAANAGDPSDNSISAKAGLKILNMTSLP